LCFSVNPLDVLGILCDEGLFIEIKNPINKAMQ